MGCGREAKLYALSQQRILKALPNPPRARSRLGDAGEGYEADVVFLTEELCGVG
jgi:hypothetical protein